MAAPFTGGCMCGAVRYECSTEPVMTANCHCRDCQRATGGAYASVFFVPRNAVKITGEVKYYDVKGESGNILSRGFCPTCGSRLFGKPAVMPDLMGIMAGSLDDPSSHRPAMDIYTTSAQPWDYLNPELPKFPKSPPM
ncbi:MAG TPA: GFA family protein [Candidatus Binatia bacterium]|nr:GFA family protein [Candidatus Binatia bacterium]